MRQHMWLQFLVWRQHHMLWCLCMCCRVAAKVNGCWRLLDPVYGLIM
jgi:hypothetical protein